MIRTIKRLRARVHDSADDDGSVLLLTLGYAILAIALIVICLDATSLYLAQKRLDSLADAAALAGADGFTLVVEGDTPTAELNSGDVWAQAESLIADIGASAVVVDAGTPDGISARVTLAATWRPPVSSLFVPDGVTISATATSRTALR